MRTPKRINDLFIKTISYINLLVIFCLFLFKWGSLNKNFLNPSGYGSDLSVACPCMGACFLILSTFACSPIGS